MENSTLDLGPRFGEASLSNCEREQIHLPGSIQPHGALAVLQESDLRILQASANLKEFLGLNRDSAIASAADISPHLTHKIQSLLTQPLDNIPASFRCKAGNRPRHFDCYLHRTGDALVIEFLGAESRDSLPNDVQRAMQKLHAGKSMQETCDDAAQIFFELTGYDRVMVYQFDNEGHGQVIAEKFEKDLEPYLGNRYPASDIPQIARRLYLKNRVRMLVDVNYEPVRIEPRLSPLTGAELDMSMCFLRSISPIHVQYLQNMGVSGTLVISIVVGGELWGLISCHHYSPHLMSHLMCTACEFLTEDLAIRIAEYEAHIDAEADVAVRQFETRVSESISRYGDWKSGLFDGSQYLLRPLDASGAALFVDGEFFTTGDLPSTHHLREIRDWLAEKNLDGVFQTASLGQDNERFEDVAAVASGVVAVPISPSPGELLMWFRPQQLSTDIWGGDPTKAIRMGDDPSELSPRRSFEKWYQEVEGTSVPWSSSSLYVAARLGQSIGDAIIHNRSVRALIAEDQLTKAIRQVGASDLPVVITDIARTILLANEAFQKLLPPGVPHLGKLEDLPRLFANPETFRQSLTDLCDRQQPWRGEVGLLRSDGTTINLLVRGDPVQVPPTRTLGFLFMFMDMTEYAAAEDARQSFQEVIVAESATFSKQADPSSGTAERDLFSLVVGNAQSAALEITNGVDVTHMPESLQSIHDSVGRSARLLAQIMNYGPDETESGNEES